MTRLVLLLTIGLILIAVQGSERETLLSPGPLTFQHTVVGGCAGCHQEFSAGAVGWVKAAFGPSDPGEGHGDAACHNCHDFGPDAGFPHSRPLAETDALTRDAVLRRAQSPVRPPEDLALAAWVFGALDHRGKAVGCSTCHREHRGVDEDLTRMQEGACQSCHADQFDSFGHGHPAFGESLFERRPRIAFDHASHLDRHFLASESAGKVPKDCAVCHVPESDGRFMATRPFEGMCGSCHDGDIAGDAPTGDKGLAFLTVPGLDVREFEARGVDIGDWPRWSEEPVTPFMRRMLERDAGVAAALGRLDDLDPLDLREASPEDIRAAAAVAMAVKRLIGDLVAGGVQAAQGRLAGQPGAAASNAADVAGNLLGHMPLEVLQVAARDWFPRLADELDGKLPTLPKTIPGPDAPADQALPAGAAAPLDQSDILAPPPGGAAAPLDQSDILLPPPDGAAAPLDQSDILLPPPGGAAAPLDQSDILLPPPGGAEAPLDQSDILLPPPDGAAAPLDQSEILAPPPDAQPPATAPVDAVQAQADLPAPPSAVEPEVGPADWMADGGWYRREFALLYRPTGHADPFLRAWLDVAALDMAASASGKAGRLMGVFEASGAPGACLKCHSVDRSPGGVATVNWVPARSDPARRSFVRFSHEPHFSLIAEAGCQTCHAVVRAPAGGSRTAFQAQYRQGDPMKAVVPGFASPTVETCSECHAPGRAGDACTQCHAYHVGRFEAPTVRTRMEVTVPATK